MRLGQVVKLATSGPVIADYRSDGGMRSVREKGKNLEWDTASLHTL